MKSQGQHLRPKALRRIALFGMFGIGNFGNEASLTAMIQEIGLRLPQAGLTCICANPVEVERRHRIPALPFRPPSVRRSRTVPCGRVGRLVRFLLRAPRRAWAWVALLSRLRGMDVLVMPGTGMVDDYRITPADFPSDLNRWSFAAKLCGVPVYFVSVGAGPIHHPRSRELMKAALQRAAFRSYRDRESWEFARSLGCAVDEDRVAPDLAFALRPVAQSTAGGASPNGVTVGVGVMTYLGWGIDHETEVRIYAEYLRRVTALIQWLLEEGYAVRLVTGELDDGRALDDVCDHFRESTPGLVDGRLAACRMESWDAVCGQIAGVDFVIASRFHNVLCALLHGKPVISMGYAAKNDALLREFGLSDYCQRIETWDDSLLRRQVMALTSELGAWGARVREQSGRLQLELTEQSDALFGAKSAAPSAGVMAGGA